MAAPIGNPLRFDHLPLGNAVRILSARASVPVTIKANAKAPVTGDFSRLDLRPALAEAAAQAGLELVVLGKTDADGFLLRLPKVPVAPAPPSALVAIPAPAPRVAALLQPAARPRPMSPAAARKSAATVELGIAAGRRAALLKQREALVQAESNLETSLAGTAP